MLAQITQRGKYKLTFTKRGDMYDKEFMFKAHGTFNFKFTLDICCQRFHQQPEDVLLVSFQPCFSVDTGSKLTTGNLYS